MAKELAMLERNEIGRSIRRYFIQKEKEARRPTITFNPLEGFTALSDFTKGLKSIRFNNVKMYPYQAVRKNLGYSAKSSSANHKRNYGQHFLKMGEILYVSEEFASHLAHSRACYLNREKMKHAQPVLPLNFGDPTGLLGQEGGLL